MRNEMWEVSMFETNRAGRDQSFRSHPGLCGRFLDLHAAGANTYLHRIRGAHGQEPAFRYHRRTRWGALVY